MSISAIGAIASANTTAELAKSVHVPTPAPTATLKPDTVEISSQGHAAAKSSDGDSDAS
jgi:hypothetical protein